ncbi:MAG: NAD-dependent dehydratase [Candidatus Altiarchaeales archaeon HGW-Altiarchaeales-1]|nr:MAG: NAD-dependent dehydratase [Candidatus Altiarchaeales archaeon HGW-Altiarchaeales-1]
MKSLVTGGAGFIGRWVVKRLLDEKHNVWVVDDISNGREENIREFKDNPNFKEFVKGDIRNKDLISDLFKNKFDICIHAAAQINVQESLDNPQKDFEVNVIGTYNILQEALKYKTKVVLLGTCMVYDLSKGGAITEEHKIKPASPYAGSKVAAEALAESYYHGLGLPVVIVRPFNTYGPFQKANMEGGVVSIFVKRNLEGETLNIFGDGTQTRDLLYVEDCADFIVKAAFSEKAVGEVINAGCGKDISINDLAMLIAKDKNKIKHVSHHHPQSEIPKLLCNYSKAKELLGWEPKVCLEEGIKRLEDWMIKSN